MLRWSFYKFDNRMHWQNYNINDIHTGMAVPSNEISNQLLEQLITIRNIFLI